MKPYTPISIGVLTLLLGAPGMILAQANDKPKQDEPKQHENQGKPSHADEDRPKDVKPEKRDDMKPEGTKSDDMKRPDAKPEDMKRQEANHDANHNDAREGGRPSGKRVQHIPEDRFRQNFGREHVTVINRPVIVEGRPHFQFGGYWFGIADQWPGDWTYTDQVYVDYIDGQYFLFNVLHPGVRVALFVTE